MRRRGSRSWRHTSSLMRQISRWAIGGQKLTCPNDLVKREETQRQEDWYCGLNRPTIWHVYRQKGSKYGDGGAILPLARDAFLPLRPARHRQVDLAPRG